MSSHQQVSLTPFNLSAQEYEAMFDRLPPQELHAVLLLTFNMFEHGLLASDQTRSLAEFMAQWRPTETEDRLGLRSFHPHAQARITFHTLPVPLTLPADPDAVDHSGWRMDNTAVQVGFMRRKPGFWDKDPVYVGMLQYDECVFDSGSLEPCQHRLPLVEPATAMIVSGVMGGFYRNGAGVWCRSLLEMRNKLLIAARCWQTGRDPNTEYDHFLKAGGWYYLQYPELCP